MAGEFDANDSPSTDNKSDEVINIRLPRAQYELLRAILKREEAYGYWESKIKGTWVWVVGGGLLTLFLLWDKVSHFMAVKV